MINNNQFHQAEDGTEDMAGYWMTRILKSTNTLNGHIDIALNTSEQEHCLLFSLLYMGQSLDAIDTRLMHIETLMKGIYCKGELDQRSWNSLIREINDLYKGPKDHE